MRGQTSEKDMAIDLAEAIQRIREELEAAQRAGESSSIQFPVQTVTVQLHITAVRKRNGHAGFTVPLAEAGISADSQRETGQSVTLVFGPPVLRATGQPLKLERGSTDPLD